VIQYIVKAQAPEFFEQEAEERTFSVLVTAKKGFESQTSKDHKADNFHDF